MNMETDIFYLSSHDFMSSPEPRACKHVGDGVVRQTRQTLICVEVSPPLPRRPAQSDEGHESLLLGPVDPTSQLCDIGTRPFMVDVYVTTAPKNCREYDSSDLERIGCGRLHSEMAEALEASALED